MQVPLLAGNYNRRTQGQEGQGDRDINQSSSYITIIILLSDISLLNCLGKAFEEFLLEGLAT
jgi:hypothetical protein